MQLLKKNNAKDENRRQCITDNTVSLLHALHAFFSAASLCCGACVELDSDTEAVVNQSFKLVCISCKKRGEVQATASVSWYFRAANDKEYSRVSYHYQIIKERLCVNVLIKKFKYEKINPTLI